MGLIADTLNRNALRDQVINPDAVLSTGFMGEFAKGLDSGTTGIHGGLRAMGGTIAEAMGADELAQSQYQRARELQARAQTEAPRVNSYKQVLDDPTARNALHYMGGILGGSAPSIGLGMGAGMLARTALGGIAAGTAALTPIEAGDVAMKQLNDPEAMQTDPLERFGRQAAGGAASSVLQTAVPSWIGGKLVGRGAEQAAKQTIGQIVGRNALAVPAEGVFEGGSDALKQYASNDERALDWDSIKENFAGGIAAGGALSGVGTVGDLTTRNVPMARNAIGTAYDAAQKQLTRGKTFAGEQIDSVADSDTWQFVSDIADTGTKMATKAWDAASEVAKAMAPDVQAKGEKVAAFLKESAETQMSKIDAWKTDIMASEDISAELKKQFMEAAKAAPGVARNALLASIRFASESVAKAKAASKDHVASLSEALSSPSSDPTLDAIADGLPLDPVNEQQGAEGQQANDQTAVQKAMQWGQELIAMGDKLSTEARSSLEEHLKNVQNPIAQRAIAGMKRMYDAAGKKVEQFNAFAQAQWDSMGDNKADPDTKQSADYSGIEKVISEKLIPWFQKNSPQSLDPNYAVGAVPGQDAGYKPGGGVDLKQVGAQFRRLLSHTYKQGRLVPPPAGIKYALFQAFGDDAMGLMGQMHEAMKQTSDDALYNHYTALTNLAADQKAYTNLVKLIAKSTPEGGPVNAESVAANLLEWATKDTGSRARNAEPDKVANAKTMFQSTMMNDMMAKRFGPDAKRIMKALEAEATRQRDVYGQEQSIAQLDSDGSVNDDEVVPDYKDTDDNGEWVPPQVADTERVFYGRGARTNSTPFLNPKLYDPKQGHAKWQYGIDRTAEAKANHPDGWDVRWRSEHELEMGERRKTHGYTVAEKAKASDGLTDEDYRSMMWDTERYGGKKGDANPSRLRIGDYSLDATKIGIMGKKHMQRNGYPATGDAQARKNQALMHGVAQLMLENPTFKMPDNAVVWQDGAQKVTFGQIKNLGKTTEESKDSRQEQELKSQITAGEVELHKGVREALVKARPADGSAPNYAIGQDAPVFHMKYRDGMDDEHVMRPEFRGKSTMDLTLSGDRTATTGSLGRFNGAKKGDVVMASDGRGKRALVRFTSDPYPVAKMDAEKWSKLEGWAPSVLQKYRSGGGYQATYELVQEGSQQTGTYARGAFADLHPNERATALGMVQAKDWRAAYGLTDLDERLAEVRSRLKTRDDGAVLRDTDNGRSLDLSDTQDVDPKGQIHDLTRRAGQGEDDEHLIKVSEDGTPLSLKTRAVYGKPDTLEQRTKEALIDRAEELIARGNERVNEFDNDGYAANKGEIPKNPEPGSVVQRKVGFKLSAKTKYVTKDQRKANLATAFIGVGSAASSTNQYAEDAAKQDMPANEGKYTSKDVVFISAEGLRGSVKNKIYENGKSEPYDQNDLANKLGDPKQAVHSGRISPDFDEIQRAMNARATLLTDIKLNRDTEFNLGEREVARYLSDNGYTETKPGRWEPKPTFTEKGVKGYRTADQFAEKEGSAYQHGMAIRELLKHYGNMTEAEQTRLGLATKGPGKDGAPTGMALMRILSPLIKKYAPGFAVGDADTTGAKQGRRLGFGENAAGKPARPAPPPSQTYMSDPNMRAKPIVADGGDARKADGLPTGPVRRAPSPKAVAAKKAALVEKAASGDKGLISELSTSTDAKGLQRAAEALLESRVSDPGISDALDTIQQRLGELMQNENVAYGMQTRRYSLQSAQNSGTAPNQNADQFAQAKEYLDRSVPWVRQQLADLMHAGDYTETANLIRLSKLALNPQSTAYHESLHAFFADLRKHGRDDVIAVLQTMADSPSVRMQMRDFFSNELGVLRQLNSDPEERAAVMYQMWAAGKLKVGPKTQGLFERIKRFIAKLLGHWTADEHALHIMEYLNTGAYAENRTAPNVVYTAMMAKGMPQVWAQTKQLAKPLANMAETIVGAGSENLRDTGIPALAELANMVKRRGIDEGDDVGFTGASREAHVRYANKLGALTEGATESEMRSALQALQTGKSATGKAEAIRTGVRGLLDEMYDYLHKAGVNTADLGLKKDYFPRHWDPSYLVSHKQEFMDMARNYPQWTDPEETYQRLVGDMGSEMPTVDRPGMAANKRRLLSFISHKDAAPFMEKDLLQIMNGYITQATRRSEWSRRFQDDNSGLEALLDTARGQGATTDQIKKAKRFVEGVNGTLGDDLNPTARRMMGDMIVYQNVRLLPLAIFSSVVDPMGVVVRGGSISDAWGVFKRAVGEIPKGLRGDTRADELTRLAQDLEVVTNASLQHALGTTFNQGVVGKTGQKINDAFFRFNLMEQWNTSVRVGATQAALGFIGKHADGSGKHSARYMRELGLQNGDVKLVGGRVATSTSEGLTEAQAGRVKAAVNQWVDGAVLRPDAADSAVWMNDPHFILISHLKKFAYAFHHTILKRVVHEFKNGNYMPAVALTSYIPIMLAADMLKGMLQGGGDTPEWKKNWAAADYLMNATERAGVFGVGQFGVEALHGNWGALTGPTIEQLTDAVEVMGGRKSMKSFVTHAMPANALYSTWAKEGANDTFDNPE